MTSDQRNHLRHLIDQRQYFVCPFCKAKLAYSPWPMSANDYLEAEEQIAAHIRARHPIRRRLNRDLRRAMRAA